MTREKLKRPTGKALAENSTRYKENVEESNRHEYMEELKAYRKGEG